MIGSRGVVAAVGPAQGTRRVEGHDLVKSRSKRAKDGVGGGGRLIRWLGARRKRRLQIQDTVFGGETRQLGAGDAASGRAAGRQILRSHDHVKPSPATFCLLPSMHERLAFVFRDFSSRLSGSLDFSPLPPPPVSSASSSPSPPLSLFLSLSFFLLLVALHANGVARNRRAKETRHEATPAAGGRKRTRGRKKEPEEELEMYRSRTRSTATPSSVTRMPKPANKEEECSSEREKNERIHRGESFVDLGYTKLLVRWSSFKFAIPVPTLPRFETNDSP